MTARLDGKGKYGVWVTPIKDTRKYPEVGWLHMGWSRTDITFDAVADAMAWLSAALTWWETKYEIKEYVP